MHNISIRPVLNGFLVDVGCQQLVYSTVGALIADLAEYLVDPEKTQKRLLPTFVNRHITGNVIAGCCVTAGDAAPPTPAAFPRDPARTEPACQPANPSF